MASWKKPFTFLYSVIWRNSLDNSEKHKPPSSSNDGHASPPNPQWKLEVEAFALKLWKKLHIYEETDHPDSLDELFAPQDGIPEDMNAVSVAREVLRQEVVTTFQHIRESHKARSRGVQKLIDEQKETIETLTKQLRVLSRKVGDAQEAMQLVMGEKHDLQYTHKVCKIQNGMLKKVLREEKIEKEGLEAKVRALTMSSERWALRAEKMQEAKVMAQVRALRAEQNAALAELRAKHAASQKKMMHRRLKETESSSKTITAQFGELRQRQTEIFQTLSNNSRPSGVRFVGNKIDNFVRKSSQVMRGLWASSPHGKRVGVPHQHEQAEERGGADTADIDAKGFRTFRNIKPLHKVQGSRQVISSRDAEVEGKVKPRRRRKNSGRACEPLVVEEDSGHQTNDGQQIVDDNSITFRREQGDNGDVSGSEYGHEADQILRASGSRTAFSTSPSSEQSNSSSSDLICTQKLMSKTLGALEKNLAVLQEVIEVKQREIDRLHRELYESAKQSHAFELRFSEEKQKRS